MVERLCFTVGDRKNVFVCVRERGRKRENMHMVCERERERVCVCVCGMRERVKDGSCS